MSGIVGVSLEICDGFSVGLVLGFWVFGLGGVSEERGEEVGDGWDLQ